jgi:uncharacterized protein YecE (DUF72 family)
MGMARCLIGTSGWHYEGWRGDFYPEDLPARKWLAFYAECFPTIELNNSFYHLPTEAAFKNWRDATPDNFTFAVKASRFITHVKRLNDIEEPLNNFMSRASLLGDKLGPVLFQLPPGLHRDDARLEEFLEILPEGRHAIEFRHDSWFANEVYEALRRRGVAFCVFDMPRLKSPLVATADFIYVRFHGTAERYAGSYPDAALAEWAVNISELAEGLKDVYIYFNNDVGGHALRNATTLRALLETSG